MRIVKPEALEEVLNSKNPGMALLRLVAMDHPEYIRKRSRHYAEVLNCDAGTILSMLEAIEDWQSLCRERHQHFDLDGRVDFIDPELSVAFAKTFDAIIQVN